MLPPRAKTFIDLSAEQLRAHVAGKLALLKPARTATAETV
jgi:fructose-1-phosphate kinase PfkB-like protein